MSSFIEKRWWRRMKEIGLEELKRRRFEEFKGRKEFEGHVKVFGFRFWFIEIMLD